MSNQLITATATGEMKLTDFRMHAAGGRMGVFKTVQAHAKGNLSAIAGHPHAPLIATGTTSQVCGLSAGGRAALGQCRKIEDLD